LRLLEIKVCKNIFSHNKEYISRKTRQILLDDAFQAVFTYRHHMVIRMIKWKNMIWGYMCSQRENEYSYDILGKWYPERTRNRWAGNTNTYLRDFLWGCRLK